MCLSSHGRNFFSILCDSFFASMASREQCPLKSKSAHPRYVKEWHAVCTANENRNQPSIFIGTVVSHIPGTLYCTHLVVNTGYVKEKYPFWMISHIGKFKYILLLALDWWSVMGAKNADKTPRMWKGTLCKFQSLDSVVAKGKTRPVHKIPVLKNATGLVKAGSTRYQSCTCTYYQIKK